MLLSRCRFPNRPLSYRNPFRGGRCAAGSRGAGGVGRGYMRAGAYRKYPHEVTLVSCPIVRVACVLTNKAICACSDFLTCFGVATLFVSLATIEVEIKKIIIHFGSTAVL